MLDVAILESPEAAAVSLDRTRSAMLAELARPSSATALAARLGIPRQKANYHLRELEKHGLVEMVHERRKGNVTERIMQATAASYAISPDALGAAQPDPTRSPERLSASWLAAVAGRLLRDVGVLIAGATTAKKRLATFTLDGEVRFSSAADRAAFADELATAVTALVSKYHDASARSGRAHRVVVAVHPSVPETTPAKPIREPD